MPTLKQLTCNIEWSASRPSLPLQEYGTVYSDGLVETYIAIPAVAIPFSIHLKSDGYIAPGLSMFVYIDGEYQCNRGRNNLKLPDNITQKHHTNVDFVVRQKEESLVGGNFIGRQWTFGKLNEASDFPDPDPSSRVDYMGNIEVVVLRSAELQRTDAPNPSASEKHPLAFSTTSTSAAASEPSTNVLSDFGGLFDGSSDRGERQAQLMPFGGDMAWDDDYDRSRSPYAAHGRNTNQRQDSIPQRNEPRSTNQSVTPNPAANPAIIINVNQPAAAAPSPWPAVESHPWNVAAPSAAGSWGPTPIAKSVHGSQAGHRQESNPPGNWQRWVQGTPPGQTRSPQPDWKGSASGDIQGNPQHYSSSSSSRTKDQLDNGDGWGDENNAVWSSSSNERDRSQAQDVSRDWNPGNQNQKPKIDNRGWNNQRGTSSRSEAHQHSPSQDNFGWNNAANGGSYSPDNGNGWEDNTNGNGNQNNNSDTNGSGDQQANWDSHISNNNQDDSGWGDGDNHGEQDSGQHDGQVPWDSNGAQNGGDWNADDTNNQDNGWNSDEECGNGHDQGNEGNDINNHNDSGNDWNNADTGAQEPRASTGSNWDTSGNNQGNRGRTAGVNDKLPATAGGFDPARPRSRRASFGKTKSVVSNLSKQASINAAVQKTGWASSGPNDRNKAGSFHAVSKPTEHPPGAWPDNAQNLSNPRPVQNGLSGPLKPYHVTSDAAGNPKLPNIQPAPPVMTAPPLPPPPPFQPAIFPYRVRRGEPTLYQHKVASPRTQAVVEQILNITIPESDDVEKAKLANLSKEQLIEEVIKTKSNRGSRAESASVNSLPNAPPSVNNFAPNGTGYARPNTRGPSFGAELNDKLAAIAAQNGDGSSSSSGSKNEQGWNSAPPGSPMAHNGNGNFSSHSNGHAPLPSNWGGQNNANWNSSGKSASRSNEGCEGKHVETRLDKTPANGSVGGRLPWVGNGNNGGSNKGGYKNSESWNGRGNKYGDSQKGGQKGKAKDTGGDGSRTSNNNNSDGNGNWGGNNGSNGGDGGWNNNHSNHNNGAEDQNGRWNNNTGHGTQADGWNGGGDNEVGQSGGSNTTGKEKADAVQW
ncbi:MAG: hypothetical protein Q9170_000393 [Blastenia crenularia]